MRRIAISSVVGLGLLAVGSSALGADATTPATTPVSCSDALKDTSNYDAGTLATIKSLCGSLAVQDITNSLGTSKDKSIIDSLTAIGAIQGKSGTITNPDKANHIGDMLAQMKLYEGAKAVGENLKDKIGKGAGTYVLVTDPNALSKRYEVSAISKTVEDMGKTMDKLVEEADKQISNGAAAKKTKPVGGNKLFEKGEINTFAIPAVVAALPSIITAAKAIASLFKTDATLNGFDVSSKAEVIAAGISNCRDTGIVLPQYSDGKNNAFMTLYSDVYVKYWNLRQKKAAMDELLGKLAAGAKPNDEYATTKKAVDTQISEFEALDKALKEIPSGKTSSQFSDLLAASAGFGPPGAGILLVTASHIGASGGTIQSQWRDDRLSFRSTLLLSYLLVDSSGHVLASGAVSNSGNSLTSVTDSANGLAPLINLTNTCPAVAATKG